MTVAVYSKPRRTWIDITAADVAAGIAAPGQLLAAFDNNDQYLHDILIGRDTDFSATDIPHAHIRTNERPVAPQWAWNIIPDSAPGVAISIGGTFDAALNWHLDKRVTRVTSDGFLFNGVTGATAYVALPGKGVTEDTSSRSNYLSIAASAYGARAKMTVSLYARLAEAPAAGEQDKGMLSFGIADGSTTFLPKCQAVLHYTDLSSTTWKRFYSYATASGIEDGCRFVVKQSEQASIGIYVTAMMCGPGHVLGYWVPSRLDQAHRSYEHYAWQGYGIESCPVAEKATSITNAVELEAL